jgi:hypothetical protein
MDNAAAEKALGRVAAIRNLRPGALYAVTVNGLTEERYELLAAALKACAPGVEFLIFDSDVQVTEVRPVGERDIKAAVRDAMREVLETLSGALAPEAAPEPNSNE